MNKLYLYAKTIHRSLVILIVIATFIMAGSGMILKNPKLGQALNMDLSLVRYLHNNFSVVFTILLLLMILSGVVMYIFPLLKKRPNF